jgi:hypothetical protein
MKIKLISEELEVLDVYDELTLEEFAAKMAEIVAQIPEECRAAAKIDVESDYDEGPRRLRVTFQRHQTEQEAAQEVARMAAYNKDVEQRERRQLAELQRKYGGQ